MKKILIIMLICLTGSFVNAKDDQQNALKKLINKKISFPEKLKLSSTETIELQFEILPTGCIEITAYKGNAELAEFIYEKISSYKLAYNPNENNVFIYKFTFEKEEIK